MKYNKVLNDKIADAFYDEDPAEASELLDQLDKDTEKLDLTGSFIILNSTATQLLCEKAPKTLREFWFEGVFENINDLVILVKKLATLEVLTLVYLSDHDSDRISAQDITALLKATHPQLKVLNIGFNMIDSEEKIDAICQNISPSITSLNLKYNFINQNNGSVLERLCIGLPNHITHLDLSGNFLTDDDVTEPEIAVLFQTNLDTLRLHLPPTVKSLGMRHEEFYVGKYLNDMYDMYDMHGMAGCLGRLKLILEFLKTKPNLKELDLFWNESYTGPERQCTNKAMAPINRELYLHKNEYSLKAQAALTVAESKGYRLDEPFGYSNAKSLPGDLKKNVAWIRNELSEKEPTREEFEKEQDNLQQKWTDKILDEMFPVGAKQGMKRESETHVDDFEGQPAVKRGRYS